MNSHFGSTNVQAELNSGFQRSFFVWQYFSLGAIILHCHLCPDLTEAGSPSRKLHMSYLGKSKLPSHTHFWLWTVRQARWNCPNMTVDYPCSIQILALCCVSNYTVRVIKTSIVIYCCVCRDKSKQPHSAILSHRSSDIWLMFEVQNSKNNYRPITLSSIGLEPRPSELGMSRTHAMDCLTHFKR